MLQIIVHQKVKNFQTWKTIFNASEGLRRASGERSCKIFRSTEDPNEITLLVEWEDIRKLAKFSQNEQFQAAAKMAGVLTKPILFLSEEDAKSYEKGLS